MQQTRTYIVHVIVPLVIAGLIYLFVRCNNILACPSIIAVTLSRKAILETIEPIKFPWVNDNLVDACWVYSLTSFQILIWDRTLSRYSFCWMLAGISIAILHELLQYCGLIQGTFDIADIYAYGLGFIGACICAMPIKLIGG